MHIVSPTSRASWPRGATPSTLLRACFPAGTVTGAPKVRAMEIIDELEPMRRGPYGGAVGYFGFAGNMDSCIAIRTLVMQGGRASSRPAPASWPTRTRSAEYEETLNKARAPDPGRRAGGGGAV